MSSYVGVDLSTHFVDLVRLNEDDDRAEWVRVPLVGENAIDRARSYRGDKVEFCAWGKQPDGTVQFYSEWWDDVILCALEDPAGRGDTRKIARVQGVVIATIPSRVQVWTLQPAEWRKACGMSGNASKSAVAAWVYHKRLPEFLIPGFRGIGGHQKYRPYDEWPQDAHDAYAIAYAARAINQTQEEAA